MAEEEEKEAAPPAGEPATGDATEAAGQPDPAAAAGAPPGEGAEEAPPPKPKVTNVTNAQWLLLFVLLAGCAYSFYYWPRFVANEHEVLKAPDLYMDEAAKRFGEAHSTHQFPKSLRMSAYMDVIWNYETAQKARGEFSADHLFRWAFAEYEVATFKNPDSRYALVNPIRHFEMALQAVDADTVAKPEKIRYMLGRCYLASERIRAAVRLANGGNASEEESLASKAIEQFLVLAKVKLEHDHYLRRLDAAGELFEEKPPVILDATPYDLQPAELDRTEMLLGLAYFSKKDFGRASEVLNNFLESTRRDALNRSLSSRKIEPDLESRFEALRLLGDIHWLSARKKFIEIKKARAEKRPAATIAALEQKWQTHLRRAANRYENMFAPAYKVYGLDEEKLKLAEVSHHLKNHPRVMELASDYVNEDRSKTREMELWRVRTLLALNKNEPVAPSMTIMANELIDRPIRLAAWITLGDSQQALGQVDTALGALVDADTSKTRHGGAYLQATLDFSEEEFDNNPIIDKLPLVNAVAQRALDAMAAGDEATAIRLYKFLLEHFTVPQAELLHHIARLQRILGREERAMKPEGKMSKSAKKMFRESAANFLVVLEDRIPHDKSAKNHALYEAAESYFEGEYYSLANRHYSEFLRQHEKDPRVSKARHKLGLSALHCNRPGRFEEAKAAFISNISRDMRPLNSNLELPVNRNLALSEAERDGVKKSTPEEKFKARIEQLELDKVLGNVRSSSRDLWAYHSLLELGNVYLAQHKRDLAKRVYLSIMNDKGFAPSSEIFRKAAYQLARLTFDEVSESQKKVRPWPEAIARLEETLLRYDLDHFQEMFFKGSDSLLRSEDSDLYKEIRRDNSEIKHLLAKAYYFGNNPKNNAGMKSSVLHARELLEDTRRYVLDPYQQQKTLALLADGQYQLGLYKEAYENYRRAHDWNQDQLDSFERPFYSLNMADCLVSMKDKERALSLLERTKWEFEKLYDDSDQLVAGNSSKMKKSDWIQFVDRKIGSLQ